METKHVTTGGTVLKSGGAAGDEGLIEAIFSTLDPHVDEDLDVTAASAFTPGQEVPLLFGHSWGSPAIGLGRIKLAENRAIWSGRLFMDSLSAKDCWVALKHLQASSVKPEFSWGFRVEDYDFVQRGGRTVRRILKTTVYEISVVLRGAAGYLSTGEPASGIVSMKDRGARGPFVSPEEALRVVTDVALTEARLAGVPIPPTASELRQKVIYEVEAARAMGLPVATPSQAHLLPLRQQAELQIRRARYLGARV